jgi:hypothetical protein
LEKGYTNIPGIVRSRGKCDDCGQTKACSDIHHDQLEPKASVDRKTGSPRVDQYGRRLR